MSQVSKKPGNFPVRKRLKPTVNLNVASRRRKDSKDIPPISDVSPELLETKSRNHPVSVEEETTSQCSSNVNKKEINSLSDNKKTFVSEKPISSLRIEEQPKENSGHIDKVHSNQSSFREQSNKSVYSSILSHRDASKTSVNNVNLSIDDFDEVNEIDSSKHTSNKSPGTVSCVDEVVKQQSESINCKGYVNIVTATKSQKDSISEQSGNDKRYSETLLLSESASMRDSFGGHTRNEKNLGAEILDEESVSIISENCSESQSFDGSTPKYKRKVSNMAKRLSEARREFESRFSKKKPERSTLRMLDLIYYNPSTNPMKTTSDKSKEVTVSLPPNDSSSCAAEEEEVDNPEEEENLNEDNNGIPAPRVKVGPNGEIVLDEQSLVIETTQSKKSKQDFANLTVVVDSGSNTTYHTYSKKKRPRNDWSVKETVRFYKALQTLGTDFSLMQTLFPTRTRVDLKTKFKKEEKINGHLIEKALRFPSLFDISELEKEPTNEEKEKEVPKKRPYAKRCKKRSLRSLGFDEEDTGPGLKKKKKRKDNSVIPQNNKNDTGKENVETCHQYSSDDEYQPPVECLEKTENLKCTTAHRKLRTRRNINGNAPNYAALENKHDFLEAGIDLLGLSEDEVENNTNNSENENVNCGGNIHVINSNFDVSKVQPGSLVIVTAECPDNPGYQICNVFMVQERSGADSNSVEPSCISDLLSTQTSAIGNSAASPNTPNILSTQSSANSNSVETSNNPNLLSNTSNGNSNCVESPTTAKFLSIQSVTPDGKLVNPENVIEI